ncbi:hypothetical protein Z946_1413 [Sulfitobacter noctilucicola]|uniref:Putative membrane protein n=1 Tax=Sulfitobacter noctilucicola TaxID=1342301 RepID=A0A7W6M6A9_9RHOB|nr:DUF599 domain-containing protein [Sulfitobacter noctilucicola]KIN62553.1 hypothetical protein Z946_1413 [Sulfitobacter noctilucicola]MBB4172917.1 putative membrane protein [Sulfitobacter noctilucicola]
MNWSERIALFSPLDMAAVGLIFALWLLIGWRIERSTVKNPSVSKVMADYRRAWMREMITRQPRIFDAQTMGNLRQATTFFASTSMIAIGATLALIGNANTLSEVAKDITLTQQPDIVWEIKLLLVVFFLTNAFLKFVWSNRLFGYCSVLMAAVPNEVTDPQAIPMADKAAAINITAAQSFNRGLRAVYFAMASLCWLAGALPLIAGAILTLFVIWRREFASHSRSILLEK